MTTPLNGPDRRPALNRAALLFGPVFLLLGLAYLLDDVGVWRVEIGTLAPLLLIAAGVALAAGSSLGDARRRGGRPDLGDRP